MKQRLQFALSLARISQMRLTPVAALGLGDDSRQKMMLIGKSDDAEPVFLRTLDNALPIDAHRDIGFSDFFERRMEISMSGTDLNASLKILVRAAVIDRNYVATLQVCREFIDILEPSLME